MPFSPHRSERLLRRTFWAVLCILAGAAFGATAPASAQEGSGKHAGAEHDARTAGTNKASGCARRARPGESRSRARARLRQVRRCHRAKRREARLRARLPRAPSPASPTSIPRPASSPRPFAPTSFWNAPLGPGAAIDPASDTLVAELDRQVSVYGPWINSARVSTPVYTVPADQPMVRVNLDHTSKPLQAAFEAVPVPPDAAPAAGSQRHMVVWQPSTDTMWEFWKMSPELDGWHARYGGKMADVSLSPGHFTDPWWWGATATSLPLLGGLIRLDELRRGRIDHALAISIPEVRSDVFSWPAQRTDGQVDDPGAIPHGARFRLDPKLDLATLDLPPVTRMLAEAAQRYGIVLRDKAGAVTLYAEAPTGAGPDPYPAIFGQSASKLMRSFPWGHLQALELQPR